MGILCKAYRVIFWRYWKWLVGWIKIKGEDREESDSFIVQLLSSKMMRQVLGCSAVILTLCVSSLGLVYNVEEFVSEESSCTPFTPDPSINMTWLKSVEFWQIPLWRKPNILKVMQLSLPSEFYANITESELKKTCIMLTRLQETPGNVELHGFKRLMQNYQQSFPLFRDGVIDWAKNGAYEATSYIVLTDNLSYFLSFDEFKDGLRGYWLATVSDNLPLVEWDKIYRKIDSSSFPKNSNFLLESKCSDDEYIKQVKARRI